MDEVLLNHPLFEPLSQLFRFVTVGDTEVEQLISSLERVNTTLRDQRDAWIAKYGDETERYLESFFHYILGMLTKFLADEITPKSLMLTSLREVSGRAVKRRPNFPKTISKQLDQWLSSHADHPYPSGDEKSQLCKELGLTMKQLEDWFSNARRRKLRK